MLFAAIEKLFTSKLVFYMYLAIFMLALIPDLRSVSGLSGVSDIRGQEDAAINYLKTHIVKDLYPCPLASCK
jgi:hypothetical protein